MYNCAGRVACRQGGDHNINSEQLTLTSPSRSLSCSLINIMHGKTFQEAGQTKRYWEDEPIHLTEALLTNEPPRISYI